MKNIFDSQDQMRRMAENNYKKSPIYAIRELMDYMDEAEAERDQKDHERELRRAKEYKTMLILAGIAATTGVLSLLVAYFK